MNTILSIARRTILALLATLTLTILFGAGTTTRAQEFLQPFVDCVEREYNQSGAATGKYIAYFGYNSTNANEFFIDSDSPNNYFFPVADVPGALSTFYPGVHPRVAAVVVSIGEDETWFLGSSLATASFVNSQQCNSDGANSRLITYQGRLSASGAAANGNFDLRFQLFNQATGGAARTVPITLAGVPVTNGVFTVQLDLGANSLPASTGGGTAVNLKLNPAILDAENSFFEIGVRPANSTGAFTILAPRQPLTAVPLAMRAASAATAHRAAYADNATNAGYAVNAGSATNAGNATNAAQLGGVAASSYLTTSSSFGQSVTGVGGNASLTVDAATTNYTLIPGLTQTVNVGANSQIFILTDGGIQSQGTASNSFSVVDIAIFVDGAAAGERRIVIVNNLLSQSVGNWALSSGQTPSAGNHTIEVRARYGLNGASSALVSGGSSNTLLKAQLTVAVVKR